MNVFFKSLMTFVTCTGTGIFLYCLSPAGAAERGMTRNQNQNTYPSMYRTTLKSSDRK